MPSVYAHTILHNDDEDGGWKGGGGGGEQGRSRVIENVNRDRINDLDRDGT